ncbi:hypothetical protein AAG570_007907 [Ranatra chinensis]|uniref:Uncharacterized protein n=1 Tax=Ranatra chinensis TaxID=642074 RepID=A0ABD0XT69_9HEMI
MRLALLSSQRAHENAIYQLVTTPQFRTNGKSDTGVSALRNVEKEYKQEEFSVSMASVINSLDRKVQELVLVIKNVLVSGLLAHGRCVVGVVVQCSRTCDSGLQRREVWCLDESYSPSTTCNEIHKPTAYHVCNANPCTVNDGDVQPRGETGKDTIKSLADNTSRTPVLLREQVMRPTLQFARRVKALVLGGWRVDWGDFQVWNRMT